MSQPEITVHWYALSVADWRALDVIHLTSALMQVEQLSSSAHPLAS